jgi:cyclophilin family peptidyl-prolyl cis-trans isomerase
MTRARWSRRPAGAVALGLLALVLIAQPPLPAQAGSQIVVETSKGSFAFETFPKEAPVTVAHITALVKSGFYDGQRIHRVVPGFVVQFGDPQSRDLSKRDVWGRGAAAGSGKPVGVAEISPKRTHRLGAVGMSHPGNPARADSQIYVTLANRRDLDGQYAVIGQVVSGDEVLTALEVGDVIMRAYVKP